MKISRVVQSMILAAMPLAMMLPSALAQETFTNLTLKAGQSAPVTNHSAIHALGLSTVNRRALWASGRSEGSPGSTNAPILIPSIPPPGFYPGDLTNNGGPTVPSAQSHGIYINCAPACWGTPSDFLSDLGKSQMMHIADAYVGAYGNNRYTVGPGILGTGSLPHILYDSDMEYFAYVAASLLKDSGYHHIFHIYLPPGQDVCFDAVGLNSGICYSPDNQSTNFFCGYHSSVDTPAGHLLYTVEPYQNVFGCQVQSPSPNGLLVDSTADILSHETFETITDPDGTAWWNAFSLDLFGAEIGDECQNFDFGYGSVRLNGKQYEIQPEYSNILHGCAFSPYGFFWP
jgi:hypothetical protein